MLPTRKYYGESDNISELATPCKMYFDKKNKSALFDIGKYKIQSKQITMHESMLVTTNDETALLQDLNRKEYEILQMVLQFWRPNFICQLAREPVDTFSHSVKFSNFQHPKMMRLMELFRTCGLLGFWKSCEYYILRRYMIRFLKQQNNTITPTVENIYLRMSEINSLFVFILVLCVVASVVFVKERRGELHLKVFRCKIALSISCADGSIVEELPAI